MLHHELVYEIGFLQELFRNLAWRLSDPHGVSQELPVNCLEVVRRDSCFLPGTFRNRPETVRYPFGDCSKPWRSFVNPKPFREVLRNNPTGSQEQSDRVPGPFGLFRKLFQVGIGMGGGEMAPNFGVFFAQKLNSLKLSQNTPKGSYFGTMIVPDTRNH